MSTGVEIAKIGATPKRKEDYRFVTGQGCYLDDMVFENVAHAVFLRSPRASAEIRKIDFFIIIPNNKRQFADAFPCIG